MSNADIHGSKPQFLKFVTKREPSNPLNPIYNLPEVVFIPPEPPKFVKDSLNVDDIDGTKPFKKL